MYALRIVSVACYPHMPIGKVLIYRLLFVCLFVCVFVRLRITPARIKLAASNFARQEISHFGELCSPRSSKSDESASLYICM